MIRNYLKTAWRNLLKNKTFSLINIMGLALAIAGRDCVPEMCDGLQKPVNQRVDLTSYVELPSRP